MADIPHNNLPKKPLSPSARALSVILTILVLISMFPLYHLASIGVFSVFVAMLSGMLPFFNLLFVVVVLAHLGKNKVWNDSRTLNTFLCFGILNFLWIIMGIYILLLAIVHETPTPSKEAESDRYDMIVEFTYSAMLSLLRGFLDLLCAAILAAKHHLDSKKDRDEELATFYKQIASRYDYAPIQSGQAASQNVQAAPQDGNNVQQQDTVPQEPAPSYRSNRGIELGAINAQSSK